MPVNFSLTFTLSIWILSHRSHNFCLHRRFIGELLLTVYRNSHNVELVRSLFWSCASVRRKRRRSGRRISSTIIYLTHIHGRGRGSYLVITSSFVFGNLLLRFLSSWLLLRRGSGVALNGKWGGSGIWDLEDSFDSNGRRRGRMRISTTIVGMGAAAGVSCELSRSKAAGP